MFQTYPDYEEQGANLVAEIVFRTIRIVMRAKGMRRLRNLYLQFDNHSINKNYVLLSALGALTLLGIIGLAIYALCLLICCCFFV